MWWGVGAGVLVHDELPITWLTVTKALATPTNSNAHVSPVGSKVMRCMRGIHYEYIHLVLLLFFVMLAIWYGPFWLYDIT